MISKVNQIGAIIDKNFTKSDLEEGMYRTALKFLREHESWLIENGLPDTLVPFIHEKVITKSSLANVAAIPLAHPVFFKKYLEFLPEEVALLIEPVIWDGSLSQAEIEHKYGIKIYRKIQDQVFGKQKYVLLETFQFFKNAMEGRDRFQVQPAGLSLSLPYPLRVILGEYFEKPAHAKLEAAIHPELCKYEFTKGESLIQLEVTRITTYEKQNQISTTTKGRPAQNGLLKMQKRLNIMEFFPEHSAKSLKLLRTNFLAGLLVSLNHSEPLKSSAELIIKENFFKEAFIQQFSLAPNIFWYLRGINQLGQYDFAKIESETLNILSKLPENEWIDISNLQGYIKYNFIQITPIQEFTAKQNLYYVFESEEDDSPQIYYSDKHYINEQNYKEAILESFIKGICFFFASFGLLDLKYDEPDVSILGKTAFSPYDGLKYIRLTSLGAYVCDKKESYSPEFHIQFAPLKVSDSALTINIDPNDINSSFMLEPFTESISPSLLKTNADIFMRDCTSRRDLEYKIMLFRQLIPEGLPPNWDQFFEMLLQKIDPFETKSNYKIYRIPPENEPLVRLLTRDLILKDLILRAEEYHILIDIENIEPFKRRLKEFGYFLTA